MLLRMMFPLRPVTVAGLLLLAAACAPQQSLAPDPTPTLSAQPTRPAATATAAPRTPTAAPQVSPTPTANITVASPANGVAIGNPVKVTGKARVFEAALMVALRDGNGNLLGEMPVMASMGAPEWGDYTADLRWDAAKATTAEGVILAFTHSARDGTVIDEVRVNVTLPRGATPAPAASPGAARTPSPGPTRSP